MSGDTSKAPKAPQAPKTPKVLMLGTALDGYGGIAAALTVLRAGGLFERAAVRYLATHAETAIARKALLALGGLWRTAWICVRTRPLVVHVHAASHASFYRKSLLLLLARRAGCQTVFHLHGGGFHQFAAVHSGAVARRWIRHTLEASSAVIALSDGWAGFVRGFAPGAQVRVVGNAVALAAASTAMCRRAPACAEAGRILFLGRAEGAKGIFDLLTALAALAPAFPQVRLVVGGEGDLAAVRRCAQALGVASRVELPGWLGADAKARELARAAVFCLPSHAEGMPMAMLEAMACAKAVVLCPVGGVAEAVVDGVNGLLVAPGDTAALTRALATVLADDGLRAELGRQARATIAARFSPEAAIGKLMALYDELADERAEKPAEKRAEKPAVRRGRP